MLHPCHAIRLCALGAAGFLSHIEPVSAQTVDLPLPASVSAQPVKVVVQDDVEDGCWTNAEDVEAALTLPLRQSGVQLTTRNEIGDLVLVVTALGRRQADTFCFGTLMVELAQIGAEEHPDGSWIFTKRITGRNYVAVSGTDLNLQFVEVAESTGRIIANLILEAQNPDLTPTP